LSTAGTNIQTADAVRAPRDEARAEPHDDVRDEPRDGARDEAHDDVKDDARDDARVNVQDGARVNVRDGARDEARGESCGVRRGELFGGTARIFAAEALLVPVGVATAAFLSRRFGPEGYGLWTLACALVVWVESNVAAALSRPSIKLVGETNGHASVGAAVLRLYTAVGVGLALLLWAASPALAAALGEPELSGYLRLLSLDVPLFCAAQAHRNLIVGAGLFRERATLSAARWAARLLLVVVFVEASGSLKGALWGSICASAVELFVCRRYARPRLFGRVRREGGGDGYTARRLLAYALPLIASALCVSLHNRLDLIMLKALGGTSAEAGVYGVAQNLALLPSLVSFSFAPVLLSTLSRALRDGDAEAARRDARQAMRAVLLLLPLASVTAGAAPEIVGLIFGAEFVAAAPPLRLLIFGSLALLMLAVTSCVLTAAGKPRWTLHVALPLVACAAVGHSVLIPRAGATGAAFVTASTACAAALVTVGLVRRLWRVAPPAATLWRSGFVSVLVYKLTAFLPGQGFLVVPKLLAALVLALLALLLSGEFAAREWRAALALLRRRPRAGLGAPGGLS
jgi:O-antigen/teichoic acid export membrane protein